MEGGEGAKEKEEGCSTYALHRVAAPPPRKGVGPWEEAGLSSRSWTNGELACAPRPAIAKPIPLLLRGGRGSRRPPPVQLQLDAQGVNAVNRGSKRWLAPFPTVSRDILFIHRLISFNSFLST